MKGTDMEKIEETVDEDETIEVTVKYRGKTFIGERKFSKQVIEINGYPDIHFVEVKNAALGCMRHALIAAGKLAR